MCNPDEVRETLLGLASPSASPADPVESYPLDFSFLMPPSRSSEPGAWDEYWSEQVWFGLAPGTNDTLCCDKELLAAIEARGVRTVLCAGAGVSFEPAALAAAGLDVTALDLSPYVTRALASLAARPAVARRFLDASQVRPGGRLTCVSGDFTDTALCPGPFDLIVERRTLQLFPEPDRASILAALMARLAPNGVFYSHCHEGASAPARLPCSTVEPALEAAGLTVVHDAETLPAQGRAAFFTITSG